MRLRIDPERGEAFEAIDLPGLAECAIVGWARPAGPGKLTHSRYVTVDGNPRFLQGLLAAQIVDMTVDGLLGTINARLSDASGRG